MFNQYDNLIKWKGKTYNEIIPIIKCNNNNNLSLQNTFLPNPCKIYRYELPNFDNINVNNERISSKIYDSPGSTTRYSNILDNYCNTPLYNNLIIQKDYNVYSSNNIPIKNNITNSIIHNSIRRLRSSGMNNEKPLFISNTQISTNYYNNQCQYLNNTLQNCNIYNPNNIQFSQQGAVSCSNYILRKNFDTNYYNNKITSSIYKLPILYADNIKNNIGDTNTIQNCNLKE